MILDLSIFSHQKISIDFYRDETFVCRLTKKNQQFSDDENKEMVYHTGLDLKRLSPDRVM